MVDIKHRMSREFFGESRLGWQPCKPVQSTLQRSQHITCASQFEIFSIPMEQVSLKMDDIRRDRSEGLHPNSKRFEEFVDNELDGDISDLEISDDEDADPDFQVAEHQMSAEELSSSEDENNNSTSFNFTESVTSQSISSTSTGNTPRCLSSEPAAPASRRRRPRPSQALNTRDSTESVTSQQTSDTISSSRVYWRKQSSFEPLPAAPTHEERPTKGLNLPPQDYICKYIPDDIFHLITIQTNRRYIEEKGRPLISNDEQTKKFFGASMKMSIMELPRTRMYYDTKTKVPSIASILPRDQFFAIRNNIKLVYDNDVTREEKAKDKFWKVSPLINSVRTGCRLNERSSNVAVDEQMVPFWGHCPARQVIKSKPNPCGIKIFVAASPDGLPMDFFFYNGKGDPIVEEALFSNLTIGGKAVIKLLRTFPKGVSVYMDRYFTSEFLMDVLHSEAEATGTGTLQNQRVPKNNKLQDDKEMKKAGRGSVDMSVRSDGQVCLVKWFDNKPVLMISSKEGAYPVDKCKRWCKVTSQYIQVERPLIVKNYNIYMGGVDFLDRLISYYRIKSRTRKWTVRVIMHLFDFSISASWIEYRRDQRALQTPKKDVMDLMQFRSEYADFLIHGGNQEEESDTASDSGCSIPPPRRQPRVAHPPDVLRSKNVLHLAVMPCPAAKNRCRFPGCSSNGARIKCSTCQVYLCIQETRNCFEAYHLL